MTPWRRPKAARDTDRASTLWPACPCWRTCPTSAGRKVLVRADFNVPLRWPDGPDGPAVVADDFRIAAAMPTLDWLTGHGAEVTVCSHLGRPQGTADHRFDMAPVRRRLAELAPGVELLDNLRFDPGEKANDPAFVDRLVDGFDCYVNDAFGVSHRAHASIVGPPARLPSAAGRLLAREVAVVGGLLTHPARPFLAVVGGAKVSDKLGVLRSLLDEVDQLIVGGGMAFTFLAAQGHSVGLSLFDPPPSRPAGPCWTRPGTGSCCRATWWCAGRRMRARRRSGWWAPTSPTTPPVSTSAR